MEVPSGTPWVDPVVVALPAEGGLLGPQQAPSPLSGQPQWTRGDAGWAGTGLTRRPLAALLGAANVPVYSNRPLAPPWWARPQGLSACGGCSGPCTPLPHSPG